MKYLVLALVAVLGFAVSDVEAGVFRPRVNVQVNRVRVNTGRNVQVQRVVVRGHNQAVVQRVVVNDHHNHVQVQRVIVNQPVYQDVVVEKLVVDNHGHQHTVRSVQRIRVR